MINVLFLIHDLGPGGAEKVLVNLVNNMDRTKFDITVMALFGGGVNEQSLKKGIRLINCHACAIRGNSHVMKLLSPEQLHRHYIKDHYDVEVAYLEGPCARIVCGCENPNTKLVSWIHTQQKSPKAAAASFRSVAEATRCYNRFDRIIAVSQTVKDSFLEALPVSVAMDVLYNTYDSDGILGLSRDPVINIFQPDEINLIGVGKVLQRKGFHRLIPIVKKLRDAGHPVHLYILGTGPMKEKLEQLAANYHVHDFITLLGYHTNPYKYVANCDLFVCSSYAEGFSTAAAEALIVGTPVCTVEVSGMKEMLGEHNEWGIVTENNGEALYQGIKGLLDDPAMLAHFKEKAFQRGEYFNTGSTVKAVEGMLLKVLNGKKNENKDRT